MTAVLERDDAALKITGVTSTILSIPRTARLTLSGGSRNDATTVLVELVTDAGLTGVGQTLVDPPAFGAAGIKADIDAYLSPSLVGQSPFDIARLHGVMERTLPGHHATHAAIDLALWDIKGKALGMPVWKLLGGGFTKALRPYASSLFGATPAETGERARRFAGQGFTAVKFGWDPMGQDAKNDVALVREARIGLGPDADLMIDAGLVFDARTAIQRARAFEQYDLFWFEEPLMPDDYDGYAKLSAASPLRIAAGEEESERKSYVQLMDVGKIDVVQVDLTRCGGFTEAIKIAALAADRGIPVVNHGFTTYLNVAAALHFLASVPNTLGLLEFVVEEGTTLRHSISEPIRAVDGMVGVPDAPGLGLTLNEEGIARFRV
jgi:L-rhamnonate dehydratase